MQGISEELLLQIGAGGVLAIILIREVVGFVKWIVTLFHDGDEEDDQSCSRIYGCLEEILDKTRQLYDWHSLKDERGVPVWYSSFGNEDLKSLLRETIENIRAQTELSRNLLSISSETLKLTRRLEGDVNDVKQEVRDLKMQVHYRDREGGD